jgi:hypothetical protein
VIPDFSFQISTLTGAQPANALKRGSPIEELADGMTNLAATTNGHHDQVTDLCVSVARLGEFSPFGRCFSLGQFVLNLVYFTSIKL